MERDTFTSRGKKLVTLLCILMLLCGMFLPRGAAFAVEKSKPETVNVGVYQLPGYHEKTADGTLSGYGYDFLQMIAGYAHFQYKYVGYDKTWNDMFRMLDDGEIDMLTSAQYTTERAKKYDFSEVPIGYSFAMLTTSTKNKTLSAGDYDSYQNMRVGMMKGSSQNEKMLEFAEKHQFTIRPVYYDTQEELEKALQKGESVDAIVTSSIRVLGKERLLERFASAPYYAIVKKGNTALMDKINDALRALNQDNPTWDTDLYEKYYAVNDTYQTLEPEEQAYLEQAKKKNKTWKVLINPDMRPYSYFDGDEPKGILVDYFDEVCAMYGLKVKYLKTKTSADYLKAVYREKADFVLTTNHNLYEADHDGYYLTPSFLNAPLCLVTHNKKGGKVKVDEIEGKIAVVSGMSSVQQLAAVEFKQATIVSYQSAEECINAVKSGKAEGALLYEYAAYQFYNADWKNEMQLMTISDKAITFAVAVPKKAPSELYSLICQGVESVSSTEMQSIISEYVLTSNAKKEPVWLYVYHRPVLFISILATIFLILLSITLWKIRKRADLQRKEKERAEYEMAHDSLTGLYNRKGYWDITKKLSEKTMPMAYLQIDVDYFKSFNDTYGHALGDEVLIQVAKQLQEAFREDDYVFRFGGDEFAVILMNCADDAWESISNKQQIMHLRLNQILKKRIPVTLSIGIHRSENGFSDEMVELADSALYQVKQNGRAGCCVVDEKQQAVYEWKDDIVGILETSPLVRCETGACHMEIPNDPQKKRRLVCDETARALMGFSEYMTPEACYEAWISRVEEASRSVISNAYRAFKDNEQAECTYLYRHPIRGSIIVRSGGRAEQREDGLYLYGYHQSLQDTHMFSC